jgi:hypothetical protein
MPSSTSSSEVRHGAVDPVEREIPTIGVSAWLALLVFLILMASWEAWVRSEGVHPSYRNSDNLWAEQRRRIDSGEGDGWVFTGSSRVLFDMQLAVWERLDGRRPIQLAIEGTSPISVIEGLADDEDFTGSLLVGVAPGLFFSGYEYRAAAIRQYQDETISQWLGHRISILVEPYLAFYNSDYALPKVIKRQDWPHREGVESGLEVRKLSDMGRDRNTRMWDRLEYDEEYQNLARFIWAEGWKPMSERTPEERQRNDEGRATQLDRAQAAVEKLHAKGATVVFVQMPYEGHYASSEPDGHPRELSWDPLLERTGALGLHFHDHEEMQGYWLPEWSHMTGSEADRFTEVFYNLVMRELAARQTENGGES